METLSGVVQYGNQAVFAQVAGMTDVLLAIPDGTGHIGQWVTAAFDRYVQAGVPEGDDTQVQGQHGAINGKPVFAISNILQPPI